MYAWAQLTESELRINWESQSQLICLHFHFCKQSADSSWFVYISIFVNNQLTVSSDCISAAACMMWLWFGLQLFFNILKILPIFSIIFCTSIPAQILHITGCRHCYVCSYLQKGAFFKGKLEFFRYFFLHLVSEIISGINFQSVPDLLRWLIFFNIIETKNCYFITLIYL